MSNQKRARFRHSRLYLRIPLRQMLMIRISWRLYLQMTKIRISFRRFLHLLLLRILHSPSGMVFLIAAIEEAILEAGSLVIALCLTVTEQRGSKAIQIIYVAVPWTPGGHRLVVLRRKGNSKRTGIVVGDIDRRTFVRRCIQDTYSIPFTRVPCNTYPIH